MHCATWNSSNEVVIVTPPPADMQSCALLIPSSADSLTPFNLLAEDGYAIAIAIVSVWLVGFAVRAVIRVLGH
jgi:hypothetical protein